MATDRTKAIAASVSDLENPPFFGDWVKQRRKQLDLTQAELAEGAYCSVFALRKIEAGDRRPSKQLAGMLAKALNIPAGDQATFVKVARGELGIDKLPSLAVDSLPVNKPSHVLVNLPRALTHFIGREPELAALGQMLQDPQCTLLTIIGPGGIGKSRLAVETVYHSVELFPDGLWFVSLASLNSADLIVPAIADAAGFKFQDSTNLQAQLIHFLRPKKALLVLDNAEHLLEGAGLYTDILEKCPCVKLLVTSRERLNLLSEWVFEIQGLPVPPNDQVKQFDAYSSVALFLHCARRNQADFQLRDEDRQWVIKICQIMEGMPLGIELSAAWVGLLSIQEIASEIEQNLDFLSVSMRDLPERHRSLRATLDHSWKLLTEDEKLILSRMSVFQCSFSRKAADEVCGASLPVLSSLKNKSLLHRSNEGQYSLHEVIRQYASLKLAEQPDGYEQIKYRHALYFIQYLADCEKSLQSLRQVETLDEMGKVLDDLSQAWQHMMKTCRPVAANEQSLPADLFHSALFSLSLFYEMRCWSLEAITLFKESVEYLQGVWPEFEGTENALRFKSVIGHIIAYLGLHHYYTGQYDQCRKFLEEAVTWLKDGQSRVEKAQAQVMLASAIDTFGELQDAAVLLEQSREVFRKERQDWWYALSTSHLAQIYLSLGRFHESEALFQEALGLINPGDLRTGVPTRSSYAVLLYSQNEYAKAEQILIENMQDCIKLSNDRLTAFSLSYLGRVALATQRVELAEKYLQKGIEILMEFGESYDLAMMYIHLGKCFARRPDRSEARRQFCETIRIGQGLDKFHLVYYGLVNIASTYVVDGQIEKALEIFLLLMRCPVEFIKMQDDYLHLQSALQSTLPEGQLEAAMKQADDCVSEEKARAAVLAYVNDQENSW